MNPEYISFIFEELFSLGALDVFITNIIMKKSRPAIKLSVICKKEEEKLIKNTIFKNTTSIGIRKFNFEREELEREIKIINTKYGKIKFKVSKKNGEIINYSPEYEDCKKLAKLTKKSIKEVYMEAIKKFIF